MKNDKIKELESRCKGLKVKPMTLDDYNYFYGEFGIPVSVRGYVFLINDEYVGIAGVEYQKDNFVVFSDIRNHAIVKKQTIWRCTKFILEMVKDMKINVIATSQKCNESSQSFVKACGFSEYYSDEDRIYFYKDRLG